MLFDVHPSLFKVALGLSADSLDSPVTTVYYDSRYFFLTSDCRTIGTKNEVSVLFPNQLSIDKKQKLEIDCKAVALWFQSSTMIKQSAGDLSCAIYCL